MSLDHILHGFSKVYSSVGKLLIYALSKLNLLFHEMISEVHSRGMYPAEWQNLAASAGQDELQKREKKSQCPFSSGIPP